ncbi:MAG: hypothetical protein EOP08_04270 [Proteobacteria bacterium]|nr:MAG: hypothetical protein EOP08_04270 [Pseudomonadota bacterium]
MTRLQADVSRGPRLRIVAVNDVYLLDNLPRLHGLIAHYREHDPADRLLVTIAGDFVAPSLLSSLDSGAGMVDCLNALGVTHAILGNHEDDIATSELSQRIQELACPCLGTNVRGFVPELPRFDVVEVTAKSGRTVRVGLVGVVMDDPSIYQRVPFGGATLLPPNAAARAESARLRTEEQCAAVVAMTHQTMTDDRALLAEPDPHFALVLGGHEHQVLIEQVEGTWIVKAGSDAYHAVVADLTWPPEAGPGDAAPDVTVALDDVQKYPEDLALRAKVDAHLERVHALGSATLRVLPPGEILSSVGTRVRQTTLGTLFASRIRRAMLADACVFNGGGIRGAREYTERFSFGDLETEVPFANELVVVPMPGSVLASAIVFSRSHAPVEFSGFLQTCDALVLGPDHVPVSVQGEPFDPARIYRVALVRNFFTGMDGVLPLVEFARASPGAIPAVGSGREVKLVLLSSFARSLWSQLGGFDRLDTDGDGMLTAADLERALAETSTAGSAAATAGILLRALDLDHDGGLDREDAERAQED